MQVLLGPVCTIWLAWPVLHHVLVWERAAIARVSIGSFESHPRQPFLELWFVTSRGKIFLLGVLQDGPTLRCLDVLHRRLKRMMHWLCSLGPSTLRTVGCVTPSLMMPLGRLEASGTKWSPVSHLIPWETEHCIPLQTPVHNPSFS